MARKSENPEVYVVEEEEHGTALEISKKPEQKYKETHRVSKRYSRIQELAKPSKASVKFVYDTYQNILPPRNKKVLYNFIKNEFAKTSEETEEKFKKNFRKLTRKKCKK